MNNKLIFIFFGVIALAFLLVSCGSASSPTPTVDQAAMDKRNYFYTGMAAFCVKEHQMSTCTEIIAQSINALDYENLSQAPETPESALYIGILQSCLTDHDQAYCKPFVDQAISDKYFQKLGAPSKFPLARPTPTPN